MATRTPPSAPKNNDSTLVSWLAGTVVVLVATLIVGGYWMQSQNADQATLRHKAQVYENYLQSTRTTPPPSVDAPRASISEAQATRQYLLAHTAVTPGAAFDKPGVQATGKAIVQAIDQAKGL